MFGQEPRDAVAQARLGVVEVWQHNYRSTACRLSKLTEKDPSGVDFLLALIPVNQRNRMAQVQEAYILELFKTNVISKIIWLICAIISKLVLSFSWRLTTKFD